MKLDGWKLISGSPGVEGDLSYLYYRHRHRHHHVFVCRVVSHSAQAAKWQSDKQQAARVQEDASAAEPSAGDPRDMRAGRRELHRGDDQHLEK